MLFNFLPGQEEGNVPFVIKNGFGDYSKEPDTIARVRHGKGIKQKKLWVVGMWMNASACSFYSAWP